MNIRQALLHNTGWRILAMLLSFVNNIIIVRLLGAQGSAAFFYALAIFTLVSTLLRFGLENGIIYYASKMPGSIGRLLLVVASVTVLQTIISIVVLKYFIGEAASFHLCWAVAFIVANALIYYLTAFYQVTRRYISINISAVIIVFAQMLILLSFYSGRNNWLLQFGLAKNINDALLILLTAGTCLHVIFLVIYFYFNERRTIDFRAAAPANRIFRYSITNFAATVLMFLLMRIDFWFVEKYCSVSVLGNYVQVAKIGQMALVLPSLLGGVIFPFTVNAKDNFAEKIAFFCRMITAAFFICLVLLVAFGSYIFVRLLGSDFYLVFSGICGTCAGIYFLGMGFVLTSYFEGRDMQRIVLISGAVSLLVLVAADALLVPRYGFLATAVVFSAANFLGFLFLLRRFRAMSNISLADMFLFRRSDKFILRFWKR